jgi:hypothetical protein
MLLLLLLLLHLAFLYGEVLDFQAGKVYARFNTT